MTDIFTSAIVETARLRLVPFAPDDAEPLNAIDNEPEVMEFLTDGRKKTLSDTRERIATVRERWQRLGYSWWTIRLRDTDQIIGACCAQHCANVPTAEIEIGWRLSTTATGKGYATEAGRAAARYVFDRTEADHVIAVAAPGNVASHKVMQRIGMQYRGVETHYDTDCTTYVLTRDQLA